MSASSLTRVWVLAAFCTAVSAAAGCGGGSSGETSDNSQTPASNTAAANSGGRLVPSVMPSSRLLGGVRIAGEGDPEPTPARSGNPFITGSATPQGTPSRTPAAGPNSTVPADMPPAIAALVRQGASGATELVTLLDHPVQRRWAWEGLVRIGVPAIDALMPAIEAVKQLPPLKDRGATVSFPPQSNDPATALMVEQACASLLIIGEMGPAARASVHEIIAAAERAELRDAAAIAANSIGVEKGSARVLGEALVKDLDAERKKSRGYGARDGVFGRAAAVAAAIAGSEDARAFVDMVVDDGILRDNLREVIGLVIRQIDLSDADGPRWVLSLYRKTASRPFEETLQRLVSLGDRILPVLADNRWDEISRSLTQQIASRDPVGTVEAALKLGIDPLIEAALESSRGYDSTRVSIPTETAERIIERNARLGIRFLARNCRDVLKAPVIVAMLETLAEADEGAGQTVIETLSSVSFSAEDRLRLVHAASKWFRSTSSAVAMLAACGPEGRREALAMARKVLNNERAAVVDQLVSAIANRNDPAAAGERMLAADMIGSTDAIDVLVGLGLLEYQARYANTRYDSSIALTVLQHAKGADKDIRRKSFAILRGTIWSTVKDNPDLRKLLPEVLAAAFRSGERDLVSSAFSLLSAAPDLVTAISADLAEIAVGANPPVAPASIAGLCIGMGADRGWGNEGGASQEWARTPVLLTHPPAKLIGRFVDELTDGDPDLTSAGVLIRAVAIDPPKGNKKLAAAVWRTFEKLTSAERPVSMPLVAAAAGAILAGNDAALLKKAVPMLGSKEPVQKRAMAAALLSHSGAAGKANATTVIADMNDAVKGNLQAHAGDLAISVAAYAAAKVKGAEEAFAAAFNLFGVRDPMPYAGACAIYGASLTSVAPSVRERLLAGQSTTLMGQAAIAVPGCITDKTLPILYRSVLGTAEAYGSRPMPQATREAFLKKYGLAALGGVFSVDDRDAYQRLSAVSSYLPGLCEQIKRGTAGVTEADCANAIAAFLKQASDASGGSHSNFAAQLGNASPAARRALFAAASKQPLGVAIRAAVACMHLAPTPDAVTDFNDATGEARVGITRTSSDDLPVAMLVVLLRRLRSGAPTQEEINLVPVSYASIARVRTAAESRVLASLIEELTALCTARDDKVKSLAIRILSANPGIQDDKLATGLATMAYPGLSLDLRAQVIVRVAQSPEHALACLKETMRNEANVSSIYGVIGGLAATARDQMGRPEGDSRCPAAVDLLVAALATGDEQQRSRAASALESAAGTYATGALEKVLAEPAAADVRRWQVMAYAKASAGQPGRAEVLKKFAGDEIAEVALAAFTPNPYGALATTDADIPVWILAMSHADPRVRQAGITGLYTALALHRMQGRSARSITPAVAEQLRPFLRSADRIVAMGARMILSP